MTNRIDSQIDDILRLIETMEQHQAQKEQKQREQLDEMRLAELERQSGCNDD